MNSRRLYVACSMVLVWSGTALAEERDPRLDKPMSEVRKELAAEAKKAKAEKVEADAARRKAEAEVRAAREKSRADAAENARLRSELEALKRQKAAVVSPEPKLAASPASPASGLPAAGSGQSFRDGFKDGSGSGPELVVIPASTRPFMMGSPENEKDRDGDERPQHAVTIGSSFALGKYEVTQGEWKSVMRSNPSYYKACGDSCPVESVSWDDVQAFIKKLSEKTGQQYRLPSESEWEYACRAGGTEKYCGSNDVDAAGWYSGNSGSKTHPVGQKAKNAWGLYDMSGNVWEWVEDCYIGNYQDGPKDEKARGNHDDTQCGRVLRGGSWDYGPRYLRSANRGSYAPSNRNNFVGFRLARTLP